MAGRGSFTESFPLFGQDLEDYDSLFASKLELLLAVRSSGARDLVGAAPAAAGRRGRVPARAAGAAAGVDRRGRDAAVGRAGRDARAAADDRDHRRGAGAVRAAGRRSTAQAFAAGGPAGAALPPIGINSHTYVAETAERAADEFFPHYGGMMSRIGRERGLAADVADAVRPAAVAARRRAGRRAGRGGGEDPLRARAVRASAVPGADERRRDAAREGHALDRAVRDRGRAGGAGRGRAAEARGRGRRDVGRGRLLAR